MQTFVLFLVAGLAAQAGKQVSLDHLAPNASGVCLAEVIKVGDFGDVTGDGPYGVRVKLRMVRGSGEFRHTIDIAMGGGFNPPKPKGPVWPDSLKKGKRYWLAFCSEAVDEWQKYEQGVINFWPAGTPRVAKAMEDAIRTHRYRWKPQYDPKTGLSYGHLIEAEKKQWRIRVEKQGKVLWEKVVPGKKSKRYDSWGLWDNGYGGFPAKLPRCGHLLVAETGQRLEAKNEYGLPAATYYVNTAYDPETGQRVAVWVSVHQGAYVDLVHRDYQPKTGKLRREDRFEWLAKGGRAAGALEERWWKKMARTFDLKTGQVTREKIFRYDQTRGSDRWVKVKAAKKDR